MGDILTVITLTHPLLRRSSIVYTYLTLLAMTDLVSSSAFVFALDSISAHGGKIGRSSPVPRAIYRRNASALLEAAQLVLCFRMALHFCRRARERPKTSPHDASISKTSKGGESVSLLQLTQLSVIPMIMWLLDITICSRPTAYFYAHVGFPLVSADFRVWSQSKRNR